MLCSLNDIYYNKLNEYCLTKINKEYNETEYILDINPGTGIVSRILLEDGLELNTWSGNINMQFGFVNKKEDIDIFHLSFCTNGKAKIINLDTLEEIIYEAGDMAFYKIDKDSSDYTFVYEDFESISLYIDLSKLGFLNYKSNIDNTEKQLEKIFRSNEINILKVSDEILDILNELKNINLNSITDYFEYKNLVFKLLHLSIEQRELSLNIYDEESLILEIQKMIKNNLDKDLNINNICKLYNITPYKLQKGIKSRSNLTFYEYIKQERIRKSKVYLQNTNMPILSIANKVGYENPSKFSEVFKIYENLTPTEYREQFK